MAVVHEFVVLAFQNDISKDEQIETMGKLHELVAHHDGFISREIFYSEADNRWIDHIVWRDMETAQASEAALNDPTAAALFAKMDPNATSLSRYEQIEVK